MNRTNDYKILMDSTPERLREQVRSHIDNGWEVKGGAFCSGSTSGDFLFFQTMVLEEEVYGTTPFPPVDDRARKPR